MLNFIRKSPLGFALAAAAVVLTVSPEAREATRRLAIKGTAYILDLVDQARNSTIPMNQLTPHSEHPVPTLPLSESNSQNSSDG